MIKVDVPKLRFWLKKQPLKFMRLFRLIDANEYCRRKSILDQSHPKYQYKNFSAPSDAIVQTYTNKESPLVKYKRIAIFAGFSGDGKIYDADLYYLKELKKNTDAIVVIYDSPLIPGEIDKIKDLVVYAHFERHNEYDFGSYKRGWIYAKEHNLLDAAEELIVCNNSCYGPLYPLSDCLNEMNAKPYDFWGMVKGSFGVVHLQSYFYLFKRNVFSHSCFNDFIMAVKQEKSLLDVVNNYEVKFSSFLQGLGFAYDAVVSDMAEFKTASGNNYPLTCISKYKLPLLKVKVITEKGFCREDLSELFNEINRINAPFAEMILKDPRNVLCRKEKL